METSKIADKMGAIKAQIAQLQAEEKELKDALLNAGITEAKGYFFRVKVVEQDRTTVNYKAVLKKLKPSAQLMAAHTTHSHCVSFRVTAQKTGSAHA